MFQNDWNTQIIENHCNGLISSSWRSCHTGVSLVVEAPPVPAGAVEAWCNEEDYDQRDEEGHANDSGCHRPHHCPLGHVYEWCPEGQTHPACPSAVLGRVAGQVDTLHAKRTHQACLQVAQLVKGVFPVVLAHTTLTWRGRKQRCSHVFEMKAWLCTRPGNL